VLDDTVRAERLLGIEAGFAWRRLAHRTVVYTDRGITGGMELGMADARSKGHEIVLRQLGHT
jgi:hypothetical protein